MEAMAKRVEAEMARSGFPASVRLRPGEPQAHRRPSDDFLVLVEVPTIFVWLQNAEALAEACRPLLEDRVGFFVAPVRDGRVVGSSAVKVLTNLFPAAEEVTEWPDLQLLDEHLGDVVRRGFAGADEASSITASLTGDILHDEEAAALEAAFARARVALNELDRLMGSTEDQLLVEVAATVLGALEAASAELQAVAAGNSVPRGLAAKMIDSINGRPVEEFHARIAAAAACVEWDVRPEGAWDRVQEALGIQAST